MKIQTRKLVNQSINFSNKEVQFDKFGKSEVSDDLGKEIIENFPELVWEEGKESIEKKSNIKEDDSKEVQSLKEEIARVESVNEGLKIQLANSKEQEKVWRDECSKYQKFLADNNLTLEETPTDETVEVEETEIVTDEKEEGLTIPEGYEDVYKEMNEKNLNALKKMCKDDLSMTDETLADFKGQGAKDKLIKYIFENVVK